MNAPVSTMADGARNCQFEPLYRDHYLFVQATLARFGVPNNALEDVAQTVFISVYRNLHNLEPSASVKAFLYGFARGTAANYRKKSWREQRKIREYGWSRDGSADHGDVERLAARAMIETLMGLLPESQREAFILSESWGMKAPEIARVLDVELSTVRSRIRCARQRFRGEVQRLSGESQAQVDCGRWLSLLMPDEVEQREVVDRSYAALLLLVAASDLGADTFEFEGGAQPEPQPGSTAELRATGPQASVTASWRLPACGVGALSLLACWVFITSLGTLSSSDSMAGPALVQSSTELMAPEPDWPDFASLAGVLPESARAASWAAVPRIGDSGRARGVKAGSESVRVDQRVRAEMPDDSSRWAVTRSIRRAREQVELGSFDAALSTLARLELEYPKHSRPRTVARWRIEALCRSGRAQEARELAVASRDRGGTPVGGTAEVAAALRSCPS